jgi:hypothetical protein
MTNSSAVFENDSKLKSNSSTGEFAEELKRHRTLDSIAALSGGIAHDYNNLLTAIIGNITLDRCRSIPDRSSHSQHRHERQGSHAARRPH